MMLAQSMRDGDGSGPKVPGYKGYVPGIKSENVFGSTYGLTTKT